VKPSMALGTALCCLVLSGGIGCRQLGYLLYTVTPEPTENVPAEFNRLDDKKVAILVWAQPETILQFPHVRLELASQIEYQLKQRLKNTQVVPAEQVADYQNRNLNWDAVPPTQIGRQFGADYVVFVELLEYSTRDPRTPGLFSGRARASVVVHDVADPTARWSLTPEVVQYPTGRAKLANADDTTIHRQLLEALASRIVLKFYDHEVPRDKHSREQGNG
jgi:hypothetical protein